MFQDRLLSVILFFFPLKISVTLSERFSAGGGDNKQGKRKSGEGNAAGGVSHSGQTGLEWHYSVFENTRGMFANRNK